jgi:putative ABC transport system permease protein
MNGAFLGYDRRVFQYQGESKTSYIVRADEELLRTLGIELKEGRNFAKERADDKTTSMIVNETFLRTMGWSEPAVGRRLTGVNDPNYEGLEVIGVVKDFHFLPLQQQLQPLLIFQHDNWRLDAMVVRIASTNTPATMEFLRHVWKEVAPDKLFDYQFLDEALRSSYQTDMRWKRTVEYSAFFAVSLAGLGLLGLVTLSVVNRTKEIGVRKVLGATVTNLVGLLSKDFVKLVLLANVIAWPVAWYAMSRWLQNFAYRIDISWWVFALAGGVALLMALLTVSAQAIKAAFTNPVEALRYE